MEKEITIKLSDYQSNIEQGQGIYVAYLNNTNNQRKPITRFLDVDYDGILYIGKSKVLKNRIADLKKSLPYPKKDRKPYESQNHQIGKKANACLKKYTDFLENIFVKITYTDDFDKMERDLIDDYIKEYGEAPPFNSY